jgi:phosphoserine aminotransferase
MTRAINFNAGPAALPLPALERAREELLDFAGTGMSVMEHSHRGKEYEAVHHEAGSLMRELLGVGDDYDILFLQGGASMQFAQVPMNFLTSGSRADYVVTGVWGEKAVAEAQVVAAQYGEKVHEVVSTRTGEGKDATYVRTPTPAELARVEPKATYVHFTSNETIHGVQYATQPGEDFPSFGPSPLVCDMSSDFMWRKVAVSRFSLLYAGAQKNIGPSGVTVVIARRSLIEQGRKDIPKIFQYRTHSENQSLYNTPPTFGVYLIRNVLSWAKSIGGLGAIEKTNREKGRALYGAIDAHAGFYRCPVDQASRSLMNVVFRLPSEALEDKFVSEAKKQNMVGLKGHRSVGGIRVSTYNAVSLEWVSTLVEFMNAFARKNG